MSPKRSDTQPRADRPWENKPSLFVSTSHPYNAPTIISPLRTSEFRCLSNESLKIKHHRMRRAVMRRVSAIALGSEYKLSPNERTGNFLYTGSLIRTWQVPSLESYSTVGHGKPFMRTVHKPVSHIEGKRPYMPRKLSVCGCRLW